MAGIVLPARWTPLKPHQKQLEWMNSLARFNVVAAGRRSGKTERGKRKLVKYSLGWGPIPSRFPDPRYGAAAPTRQQAKDIYWNDLKALTPKELITDISESELRIKLETGASLTVVGMDKPERIEGQPWDGLLLDEYANMKAQAWPENIRPALSDRLGWCDFVGVPEGRNHYHKLYEKAETLPDWRTFHWKSIDILDPKEVEAARAELDELTFKQEYEASFNDYLGQAYYSFDRLTHTRQELPYDPEKTLIICFDFNVSPGIAVFIQEFNRFPGERFGGTGVVGEVYIPSNSNTIVVCNKIIQLYGSHEGSVHCYGDASGGSSGTAKVQGSDWDLIKQTLRPVFRDRLQFFVQSSNPPERARVNSVNTRLRKSNGDISMLVSKTAPQVIRDFEGVRVLEGGSGEIDKKHDKMLTHLTDAIGYYIHYRYPVTNNVTSRREF